MDKYPYGLESFIRGLDSGLTAVEVLDEIAEVYDLIMTPGQLKGYLSRHGIIRRGSESTRFKPGHRGESHGGPKSPEARQRIEATLFKKGHSPHNALPVGTELCRGPKSGANGWCCVVVKVGAPNVWVAKHALIWEQAHGPIPAGYVVTHVDRDPLNCELDNLMLITRRENAALRGVPLPPEVKQTREILESRLAVARVKLAVHDRINDRRAKRRRARKAEKSLED